jgi:hypothetical protein
MGQNYPVQGWDDPLREEKQSEKRQIREEKKESQLSQINSDIKLFKTFNGSNVFERVNELLMSRYIPRGALRALSKIPGNKYILCVGYSHGDCQIGISGKVSGNESLDVAAKREAYEEVSLLPMKINFSHSRNIRAKDTSIKISWFLADINECKANPKAKLPIKQGSDDKNNRICVLIYGTLAQVTRVLNSRTMFSKSKDTSAFIGVIPVTFARRFVKFSGEQLSRKPIIFTNNVKGNGKDVVNK